MCLLGIWQWQWQWQWAGSGGCGRDGYGPYGSRIGDSGTIGCGILLWPPAQCIHCHMHSALFSAFSLLHFFDTQVVSFFVCDCHRIGVLLHSFMHLLMNAII